MENAMLSDLLPLTHKIMEATDTLLSETPGIVTLGQTRFLDKIRRAASSLALALASFPRLDTDRTREVLSYEMRAHLNVIIGFADLMLEGEEGKLTVEQHAHVLAIREHGEQILDQFNGLVAGA